MTVILPKAGLSYISIPKVACTSLKTMFYAYENGQDFVPFVVNEQMRHVHWLYPATRFEDLPRPVSRTARYALVRDPVERFVSAYANRVIQSRDLSEARLGKLLRAVGLRPDPPFSEFVERFADYRNAAMTIRGHTHPQHYYLGRDPKYFERLFPLREIQAFVDTVAARLDTTLTLPRMQTSRHWMTAADVDEADKRRIRAHFEEDYDLFGAWL